jgi:nicotinate-nucleotide adenylyltransferase
MRVGLLGGTFDPFHLGHLDLARAAQTSLALDRVWLVPSRLPPHRPPPHASASHRFAMTCLAVQDDSQLLVSDVEMETSGPSYTAETLDRLAGVGIDVSGLFFITGADAFRDIRSWRTYPAILDRCHFVVISRGGVPASSMPDALPDLAPRMQQRPDAGTRDGEAATPPGCPAILLIDAATAPVSSTEVRRAAAAGEPLAGLVPDAVARHIRRYNLYAGIRPSDNDPKGAA